MKRYLFITIILTIFSLRILATNDSIQSFIDTTRIAEKTDTLIKSVPTPLPRPIIYDSIFSVNSGDSLILVEIIQDTRIEQLLNNKISNTLSKSTSVVQGFRVQVFSSNTQQTAKLEAQKIEEKMRETFPGVSVHIIYQSPFWKVRMGDFTQQADAQLLRTNIIDKFPKLYGDVYIVKERIEIAQ